MNKFAVPALAAALALGACGEADAPEADTAAADDSQTTVITPTATETVTTDAGAEAAVDTEEGSSLTIDGGDVDARVDEDGVEARVDVDN